MSWLNLEGKVAVVTGGACGLGKSICEGFAEVGARVVVADINKDGAEQTVAEMKSRHFQRLSERLSTQMEI